MHGHKESYKDLNLKKIDLRVGLEPCACACVRVCMCVCVYVCVCTHKLAHTFTNIQYRNKLSVIYDANFYY